MGPFRLKPLVCFPLAVGLLIAGCDSRDLARLDTSSRGQDAARSSQEIETKEITAEAYENEGVVPPENIAGAYLVQCDTFDSALTTVSVTRILCSLQDKAGRKATGISIAWSMEPNPGPENLLGQELLPATSSWHVEFLVRADYFQQNAVEVVAAVDTQAETIRLGKDKFKSGAGASLFLIDRTTELNHQAVAAATLGSFDPWSKIYQDPVTLLFVSNPLHGDIPFINAENLCAQLDGLSPWQGPWRLPSRQELTRLHRLRADLVTGFNDWFWSGETVPEDSTQAFYEILSDGQISTTVKTNGAMAAFCVADQLQAPGG
ncbi:DUF1566 domain-containing protein [Oligoflexus tunisiensis]|uniref:DUF1566 domain-containing protein n=1 Tax=Oligoflexus tunisiensis TaxID=708132 RepID=UPI00114D1637|nr:DUF1566 domain-containing protein [Oligoflexus tunisiensis]